MPESSLSGKLTFYKPLAAYFNVALTIPSEEGTGGLVREPLLPPGVSLDTILASR
jgi:hypothetical protein